ncbi:hypothetical protein SFRURICE_020891 [Spodoptera frugiperda]|nr:hypothetical protein SFRURICE_020891 [Spodoptera frugiperda]
MYSKLCINISTTYFVIQDCHVSRVVINTKNKTLLEGLFNTKQWKRELEKFREQMIPQDRLYERSHRACYLKSQPGNKYSSAILRMAFKNFRKISMKNNLFIGGCSPSSWGKEEREKRGSFKSVIKFGDNHYEFFSCSPEGGATNRNKPRTALVGAIRLASDPSPAHKRHLAVMHDFETGWQSAARWNGAKIRLCEQ